MITPERAKSLLKEVPKPPPPDLKKKLRSLEVGGTLKFKMIVDVKGDLTGLEFGVRRTERGVAALSRPLIYKGISVFPWYSVKKEWPLATIERWVTVGTQTWHDVKDQAKGAVKARFKKGDILLGGYYLEEGLVPEFYVVKSVSDMIEIELLTSKVKDWFAVPFRGSGKTFMVENQPGLLKKTRTGLGVWNKAPVEVGVDSDIRDYWKAQ